MVSGAVRDKADLALEEVKGVLAPKGAGSNLHDLALYWAEQKRPRFKRLYKGAIGPGKLGQPYKPKDDDGLRAWVENERELVVQVNPLHSDFFMHYDKKEDVVHFIVNGQAAMVPHQWLRAFSANMPRIRQREGHLPIKSPRPVPKPTLKDHLVYRLSLLREFVHPTRPLLVLPSPVDADIAREMEKFERLQGGEAVTPNGVLGTGESK